MKDNVEVAKEYTDWNVKEGCFARDMTLRDHFAGLAMTMLLNGKDACSMHNGGDTAVAILAYKMANAMLKERNK
jgi:hypothetical protein